MQAEPRPHPSLSVVDWLTPPPAPLCLSGLRTSPGGTLDQKNTRVLKAAKSRNNNFLIPSGSKEAAGVGRLSLAGAKIEDPHLHLHLHHPLPFSWPRTGSQQSIAAHRLSATALITKNLALAATRICNPPPVRQPLPKPHRIRPVVKGRELGSAGFGRVAERQLGHRRRLLHCCSPAERNLLNQRLKPAEQLTHFHAAAPYLVCAWPYLV